MAGNKGYVTLQGITESGNPSGPTVVFSLAVVAPDNSIAFVQTYVNPAFAAFAYGDSNEDIRQKVVAAARQLASDSTLSVQIIP